MASCSKFQVIALLSSIITTVAATGGTQSMCFGFNNGNGYNVQYMVENLQSQSLSSICGNFDKTLHNEYSWCSPGPINCQTNSDGSLVSLGVSTSDRDSGFSCVEAAFIETLEASVVPGIVGIQCRDVVEGITRNKRSSGPGEVSITPRGIDTSSSAGVGDTITVASGRQLVLKGIEFLTAVGGATAPTLLGGYFTDLMPKLGNLMGNTGQSAHSFRDGTIAPWTVSVFFDAGINGGPGNVNADDWTKIIASLSHAIDDEKQPSGLVAYFADAASNVVLMGVGLLVDQSSS
jgi:hypothetical protein